MQREYRAALEERTENAISGASALPTSSAFQQSSPPPRSAAADNHNMYRLEQEMNEIKAMLNDFGQRSKNANAERITDMLANLNAAADGNDVGAGQVTRID